MALLRGLYTWGGPSSSSAGWDYPDQPFTRCLTHFEPCRSLRSQAAAPAFTLLPRSEQNLPRPSELDSTVGTNPDAQAIASVTGLRTSDFMLTAPVLVAVTAAMGFVAESLAAAHQPPAQQPTPALKWDALSLRGSEDPCSHGKLSPPLRPLHSPASPMPGSGYVPHHGAVCNDAVVTFSKRKADI